MYGYTDWELQPQTYLLVGTLFLLKLVSLPLLPPWLRRPVTKQTLKMSWYLVVKNKGGHVRQKAMQVLRRFAKFAKTATDLYAVVHKGG